MARYIDVDKAYEIARIEHKDFAQSMADLTSLREVLEDTPTADVAEVKHGEWLNVLFTQQYRCSLCGNEIYFGKDKFCSECGAKMDRGSDTYAHQKKEVRRSDVDSTCFYSRYYM